MCHKTTLCDQNNQTEREMKNECEGKTGQRQFIELHFSRQESEPYFFKFKLAFIKL